MSPETLDVLCLLHAASELFPASEPHPARDEITRKDIELRAEFLRWAATPPPTDLLSL